jgi:transcription elongation factor GreB
VSKAFTKDDGPEAAPVPRRRAPLPEGVPNYVTLSGLRALREELAQLDAGPSGAERPPQAAWRSQLEHRIATAIVTLPPQHRDEIRFGATVHLKDAEGNVRALQIVGVDEADAARGLVAFTAPLARVLLGRRLGDVVAFKTPGREEELEIVGVEYV